MLESIDFLVVSCYVLLNNHDWKRWSYNMTCMYMMGWRGSLSRKRRQGTSVRRHVEINCRINPLTSIDKLAETS